MTKLTDEQICALGLPIQIGMISPGIRQGLNALVSKNSKYFAFATIVSVYIYEQNPIKLTSVVTKSSKIISSISLAPKTPQLLAISYNTKQVAIIHIADNKCISKFQTSDPIISFGWLKVDSEIMCFTRFYSSYTIYDVATGQKLRTVNGFFNNIRILSMTSGEEPIFFGGNNKGAITRIQGNKTKTLEFSTRNAVVASTIDPNNETQALIAWKHSWALYDISTMIKLIHEVTDLNYSISAACWSSFIPGQFYTGDSATGIVRIWNASTEHPLETLNLHPHGISSLVDLKRNKLFIGFTDGMIGVYDIEARKFIFQKSPGHSNVIVNLCFHPTNPNIFITAGREGAICTWNANTMKQIDHINSIDNHGRLNSMDVSPGGGMICCGYSDGYVLFFNLQTKAKLYEYKVCENSIEKVNFSILEPELLLVSSGTGFIAIMNVQERKTIWSPPKEYQSHYGFFSPHNKGQFFITTKDSKILVYNEITSKPSFIFEDANNNSTIISLAFSNFDKNILAASDIDGHITINNLQDKSTNQLNAQTTSAMFLAFHPTIDGILACSGKKGLISIFDYKLNKLLCEFHAHASTILAFAFSPIYPTLLITSACDSSIKFWSIERLFEKEFLSNVIDMKLDWARQLEGTVQLFKLAKRCLKTGDKMKFNTNDAVHINDILRLTKKTVQKSMSSSMHETSLIRQAVKNKKRLIESAKLELFMGNPKHYCEMIFASGEFDHAVAAAPAVSVNFWIEMMKNRAKLYDDDEEKARIQLLIGDTDGAVDTLMKQNRSNDAFLVQASKNKGAFNFTSKQVSHQTITTSHPYIDTSYSNNELYLEYMLASKQAKQCLLKGQVDCAASAYLSVSDIVSAEFCLLRNGEAVSAFLLDALTETKNPIVREKFALIAIQCGSEEKLFEILTEDEKKKFVVSIEFKSEVDRENFFIKHGLKKPSEYNEPGQNDYEKVHNYLLAGKPNDACEFVLSKLNDLPSKFCEIEDLVKLLQIADLSNASDNLRFSISSLSLYFGIYKAIWKGYKKILDKLQASFESCIKSHNLDSLDNLAQETKKAISLSKENMEVSRLYYIGYDFLNVQKVGRSYKNDSKYGLQYTLEDGVTKINMEEALMWFDVTPFSPLSLTVRHCLI